MTKPLNCFLVYPGEYILPLQVLDKRGPAFPEGATELSKGSWRILWLDVTGKDCTFLLSMHATFLFIGQLRVALLQMLDVTLPFDEMALLEQNLDYLQRACNLPSVPFNVHKVAAGSDPVPGPGAQPLPGKPAARIETQAVAQ